jgi:putative transposase
MLIRKGFRYRVYPTPAQEARLLAWESALRFLWNLAHEQRRIGLARTDKRYPTAYSQKRELTLLRADLPWLEDVPCDLCQQILDQLDLAWQRCFARSALMPRWKRVGSDVLGLCEPHPKKWRLDGSALRFPKVGNLRVVVHRPLEGKPKTCTVRRDGDQWFASIICEIEIAVPAPRIAPVVALDRGVVNVIADSDGNIIQNPKHMDATAKRLARAQRTLCRRKKGSKNREKAKHRVAVLHRKVRRQREHVLHNLSARYAKSHGVVVVEKLQIGNMVKANRGLARSILGAGWGRLVEQLRYKLTWSGGYLVEVPAAYSSQTCNVCDHVDSASRISQAEFCCTACGLVEHADVNAAKVLLKRFQTPGNPWCLPVDGSACKGPGRSRKRLRVVRRSPKTPPLGGV